jgi:hypothetical protein
MHSDLRVFGDFVKDSAAAFERGMFAGQSASAARSHRLFRVKLEAKANPLVEFRSCERVPLPRNESTTNSPRPNGGCFVRFCPLVAGLRPKRDEDRQGTAAYHKDRAGG